MTDRRLALHEILVTALGSRNVYYQPPATVKMKYPCIVYHREGSDVLRSDNGIHRKLKRYSVTYIDTSSSEVVTDLLEEMQYCGFNNKIVVDNLYHSYLTLYY